MALHPAGEIGRPVAIISVDIPDHGFRRPESGFRGRETEPGKQNQKNPKDFRHRRFRFICAHPYHTLLRSCRRQQKPKTYMRELFDEASGKSPLDPEEAVRRTTRGPRRKRFYANASVVDAADRVGGTLDDKPIRTPSGRQVV